MLEFVKNNFDLTNSKIKDNLNTNKIRENIQLIDVQDVFT